MNTTVLICNTGSPASPTKEAVAKYLAEFLGDRRVVELHPLIWQPILRGIIIPRRSAQSAERYRTVWTEEGSPLVAHTRHIAQKLQTVFDGELTVRWAMCYGTDRISDVMQEILREAPDRLVVLPLFAQYATQTSASVFDFVRRAIEKSGKNLEVVEIQDFFDDEGYIGALARHVRSYWSAHGQLQPDARLLMSFHGIPQKSSDRGDPYEKQCYETAGRLADSLGLTRDQWAISFQSKFGRAQWLTPSTIDVAVRLASEGVRRLDVICPGFASDCLETTEEIAQELRGIFLEAGGKEFNYISALNDSADAVGMYEGIVRKALIA